MLPTPSHKSCYLYFRKDRTGTRSAGPPVLASAKYNCVLWPNRLARLSRSLLAAGCPDPAPPPVRAVLAPGGPGILHASPSLRWFDQLGARGEIIPLRFISGEASPRQRELRSEYWTGGVGQLVFRSFFRGVLSSACFSPVYRPSSARFFIRGPKGGAL